MTTVKELISMLNNLDPELRVCVGGYEGGLTDIALGRVKIVDAVLNFNKEDFYGPHEELNELLKINKDEDVIEKVCVLLGT